MKVLQFEKALRHCLYGFFVREIDVKGRFVTKSYTVSDLALFEEN